MKKYKLRKEIIYCLCFFTFLLFIFIIKINSANSYSLEYNLEDYSISENYDKEKQTYYYEIKNKDTTYNFIAEEKYQKKKKLIKKIEKEEDKEYTCLIIESDYLKTYPLCKEENELIDYHLINETLKEKLSSYFNETKEAKIEYQNFTLYSQQEKILVWNYKGFVYFDKDKIQVYDLFKKDIYNISLATKINEYLVLPDYEQDYTFNRVYSINLNKNKIETWELKYNISFDSYIVGINKKSIYLVDKKNKIEYELVPHKKKMRIVGTSTKKGVIFNKGKEESISLAKLINETKYFNENNNYNCIIENKKLYLSYLDTNKKERISNKEIDEIIRIEKDTIYYLVKDTLYKFNKKYGETKVMTYADWEFNHNNLIFLNNEI